MGSICGSPSKESYDDHQTVEQKVERQKLNVNNMPKAQMEIIDKHEEKEFSTKHLQDGDS